MSELSHETGRQIGVLIDRKGYVESVIVGNARRIELPDLKRLRVANSRFRGLRCVHTHLGGEGLSQEDLTDLALLRLDLMAAVEVEPATGLPGSVHAAHLLPVTAGGANGNSEPAFAFLTPDVPSRLDVDFLQLIASVENEMTRNRSFAHCSSGRDHAILAGVTTASVAEAEESMAELRELAASAGLAVLDTLIQRRPVIDSRTVLGRGKLEELILRALRLGADLIVFDRELTPGQVRSISEATDLKVIDRAQLILDIFAQRAKTREGKIKVELAQLKYLLPRLVAGHDSAFSRLAGGIGGRGPGETKLETDRRRVRDRINRLERDIDGQRQRRGEQRKERLRQNLPIVSIIGYTNAGKSTLLNTLTSSNVHVEQRMFATLEPVSRRLRLPREQDVIINDTVGFIRDLPPELTAAFKATLEEISSSDLLVHLIDASGPRWSQQMCSVESVLAEMNLTRIPRLLVFNKADLVARDVVEKILRQAGRGDTRECITAIANRAESLSELLERAGEMIARDLSPLPPSTQPGLNSPPSDHLQLTQ